MGSADHSNDQVTMERLQIASTDRQIDQFVYALYGLSNDESKTVEEATEQR